MKKFVVFACLLLAGCTSSSVAKFQSNLNILGTDLGILAADLPTACGNLAAVITAVSALPNLSAAQQTALANANAAINKYCGPAAASVVNTQAAIAAIQAVVASVQAAK